MKALSIRQPWAELIARREKTVEVRSWRTKHRGELLICAGVGWHRLGRRLHGAIGERGVDVCTVELVDVVPLTPELRLLAMLPDDFTCEGQYAWVLARARRVPPTPRRGRLSFFDAELACP